MTRRLTEANIETRRLAETNIETYLAYFQEAEDYLNTTIDSTVTFEQVIDFMKRLKDAQESDQVEGKNAYCDTRLSG